ncbi:MAG: envelope stress response membrane protein PspC [Gammaproteobacteria bacterium]|nr:envelope stress response membrane protein PspC [Gammaproteobacteria bacterium]
MSTDPGNNGDGPSPQRLFRDKERGAICGVCAGVADYFGFNVSVVRILTVIGSLMFPIIFFIYIAMCLLLPVKPGQLYRDQQDERFWRSVRRSPSNTFSSVRHKFREMEARLERMERYVTSSRFNLDREFENLKRD